MREIDFEEKNFDEVARILKICEESKGTDRPQQIHFNEITRKFEHYRPAEFDSIPEDMIYEHPSNVINDYYAKKDSMANAITTAADDEDTEVLEYNAEDSEGVEGLEPIFSNDDAELLEATSHNLKIISNMQKKLQTEQRENLARVIADIYKCDTITDSDVARCIVENDEFKKLLSMLFALLGVTVSSTKVTSDLQVSTGKLTFNERISYGIEDYRRGAAQCLTDVRILSEAGSKIKDLEETNKELNAAIASIRKELTSSNDKYTELQNQKTVKKEQNLLVPTTCIISWKKGESLRFIRIKSNAKTGEDGSYPTKYLEKTSHMEKATSFTEDQAQLQLARLIKHKDNLTFVDLKEAGAKQASEFFSIYKTTIEKV